MSILIHFAIFVVIGMFLRNALDSNLKRNNGEIKPVSRKSETEEELNEKMGMVAH